MLQADQPLIAQVNDRTATDLIEQARYVSWTVMIDPPWKGWAFREVSVRGPLNHVDLEPDRQEYFMLGEAILIFGEPLAAQYCTRLGIDYADIYFAHDIEVRAKSHAPGLRAFYDPHMNVYIVRFNYPAAEPPYRFDTPPWQGFQRLTDPQC